MSIDFWHKVAIPQRPFGLVSRPRLSELLAAIREQRLITICAPVGFGKTSLLVDFAHEAPLRVCWYSLDSFDQDVWVFLDYLSASIQQCFPDSLHDTRALLDGPAVSTAEQVLRGLARELCKIPEPFVLVLDDWHLVDGVAAIREALVYVLTSCPNCRIMLSSRTYPSLPNILLLASRRLMSSLDEHVLRFTAQEAIQVVRARGDQITPGEHIGALNEYTGGWIAALQLLHQTATPVSGPIETPNTWAVSPAAQRQAYRFLIEQVFDHQPAELRTFLLDSALLDTLTADHCEQLLGYTDAWSLLDELLRNQLFITEIQPGVFRYHTFFRQFLLDHHRVVNPQRHQQLALRIAEHYAAQQQWLLAFEQCIAAGRRDAALRYISLGGEQLYRSGRLETLEHWFEMLGQQQLDTQLSCLKARLMMSRGQKSAAQTLLVQTAAAVRNTEERLVVTLAQAQLARMDGRYEDALAHVSAVLQHPVDQARRAEALRLMGICLHWLGRLGQAIETLEQALLIEQERGDAYAVARLQHDLGISNNDIGNLQQAEQWYRRASMYWESIGHRGWQALLLNSIGIVQHLCGRHQEAHATLIGALEHAHAAAMPNYEAAVLGSLGDLASDLLLWDLARTNYKAAHQLGGSAQSMVGRDLSLVVLHLRRKEYDDAARVLARLSGWARQRYPESLVFQGGIAFGNGDCAAAARDVRAAIALLEQTEQPMALARALQVQAYMAATCHPDQPEAVLAPLERAACIADKLGHDHFLVVDALHFDDLLQKADKLGWPRAGQWLRRQTAILREVEALGGPARQQVPEAPAQSDPPQPEQPSQPSLPPQPQPAPDRAVLNVRTLGNDQLTLNGQLVNIGWAKAREVLYFLLAHPDGAPIDTLREAIWPHLEPGPSRDALRSAIYQLRSVLPREFIELRGRQIYRLNRAILEVDHDVERLLKLLDTGDGIDTLHEAATLYHGPYLARTDNQWSTAQRAYLEQRYILALHGGGKKALEQARHNEALLFYQRILLIDQLDEAAHAGVMRYQIALHNRAAAIAQYQLLRRLLDEELGLEPTVTSEVELLYRELLS
ncbi:MAG TPA: BTAD domain-containing putative transcriptional regulator [Roseiflexaceae bacterium]|nr:BTAD domain-containing putative transcriptional regulator [Roseiflexaceae bacterium]